ncbi:MAG TPA: DUF3037 domain-containing protein [Terriglobales bacterium]|nr:DUF3037 domain-containing protein [Terriglobales bacterium]
MAALQQLEFFLLRYAGDITKGESINLGVAVIGPEHGQAGGFADVRFTRNLRRLHCFDPLVDTDELAALEREIQRDLQDPQKRAELLKRMNDAWSNLVQFQPLQGSLGESPAKELERLSSMYLETPTIGERRERSGRQRILAYMTDELETAGVLPLLLRNISMAEYTRPGDPLKLDFGYASGQSFKFLQAVSFAQRTEPGMLLASRFPQIAAGLKEKKGVTAWMTALVDDDLPRSDEMNFALEMMQESGIVVAPAAKMPEIAEAIRVELRASH